MDVTSKNKNHFQPENQADFLLSDWSAVFHPGRRINQDDYQISILVCPTTLHMIEDRPRHGGSYDLVPPGRMPIHALAFGAVVTTQPARVLLAT